MEDLAGENGGDKEGERQETCRIGAHLDRWGLKEIKAWLSASEGNTVVRSRTTSSTRQASNEDDND